MGLKASLSLASLAVLLVLSISAEAVNITRALEKYPKFSTMKDLLVEAELTGPINKRQTITVLAVGNDAIGSISGRPIEEIKNILMNHIVLDYYDELKLKGLKGKSTMLTTLYQTTGLGKDQNGFINCTKMGNEKISFGSGVKGSSLNSEYVGSVFHNPYNLSIIQVSMPIVAPGLGSPVQAPPPPPFTPPPALAPKKAKLAPAPGPAEEDDVVETPEMAPADAPSDDDSAPAPAPAPAPTDKGKKKMPAADEAEPPSAASKADLSFGVALVLGFVASFAGF